MMRCFSFRSVLWVLREKTRKREDEIKQISCFDPLTLTLTLSRWERGLMGQQWCSDLMFSTRTNNAFPLPKEGGEWPIGPAGSRRNIHIIEVAGLTWVDDIAICAG
jgi:hypothetical protein